MITRCSFSFLARRYGRVFTRRHALTVAVVAAVTQAASAIADAGVAMLIADVGDLQPIADAGDTLRVAGSGAAPPATTPSAPRAPADSLRIYQIDEIVVRRTRASHTVGATPFADLSRTDIDRVSFGQDVPMVLASLPSAYAYSDAGNGFGYSYLKIRGFDQNRIGMLLNGVPLNDPEAHQVYWVDHGDVLAGASSVEVQRGIGTMLFGATSFGGSVNVLTSPVAVPAGLHLDTSYGEFTDSDISSALRTYRAALATGPIMDGRAGLYARYSRALAEGYREASAADQESFALSALYGGERASHKVDLHAGREVTHFSWDGVSPDALPGGDNPCQLIDLDDRDERRCNPYAVYPENVDSFRQVITSVTSEVPLGGETRLSNTLYYVDGEGYFEQFETDEDFFDYGLAPIVIDSTTTIDRTDLVRRRWLDNHYVGLVPQVDGPIGKGRITAGAGVRWYEARHFGELVWTDVDVTAPPLDRYYRHRTQKLSVDLFSRVQWPLFPRTSVSVAIQLQGHRYDFDQERIGNFPGWGFEADHNFVSPRLGVRHALTEGVSLYGSASYAQREPSADDYIDADDPGQPGDEPGEPADLQEPAFEGAGERTRGLDDPIVKPETMIDLELGAEMSRDRWMARLGVYQQEFRDELIPVDGGRIFEEGRLARANAERTRHQGIELEAAAVLVGRRAAAAHTEMSPSVSPPHGEGSASGPLSGETRVEVRGNLSLARYRFVDHEIFAYWLDDYAGGPLRYDGRTIPRSPEVLANVVSAFERGPWSLTAEMQHVGRQYIDSENTERLAIDAFTLVNLTGAVDVARALGSPRSFAVEIGVRNLFDTLYETYGYAYYDDFPPRLLSFYWPGATRSVVATVRTVF